MNALPSAAEVRRKILALEAKRRAAMTRLERAQTQKKEGARFYQGTELPIDDVIFSLREGTVRSTQIALDFYRQTLAELNPAFAGELPGPVESPGVS